MELPVNLKLAIENQVALMKHDELKLDAQNISEKYRTKSGHGKRLITTDNEAVAYSVVRMPATYGAVFKALGYTLDLIDCHVKSILDVGAGSGAASWACESLLDLDSVTCLEREISMQTIGKSMMKYGSKSLNDAKWVLCDITKDNICHKADLVVASYMLNELDEDNRIKVIDKLWDASNDLVILVETGTPVGFSHLKKAKEHFLLKGGHVVAPCTHDGICELLENDWCHFTCRIQRSKLHKQLKCGDAPYEDEKFTYLAISKNQYNTAKNRILRHPIIEKGRISFVVCNEEGIKNVAISKKDGELYKRAKKMQCGDEIK